MKWVTICCIALNICNAGAESMPLPQLPEPMHADSEVSTNLPFNTARGDAREFGVSITFTGTASNCMQVAFGHDADGDGDLSADEARLSASMHLPMRPCAPTGWLSARRRTGFMRV